MQLVQASMQSSASRFKAKTDLRPIDPRSGYYGSLDTWTFVPVVEAETPRVPMAWLPTERVATAWQKLRRGEPF